MDVLFIQATSWNNVDEAREYSDQIFQLHSFSESCLYHVLAKFLAVGLQHLKVITLQICSVEWLKYSSEQQLVHKKSSG